MKLTDTELAHKQIEPHLKLSAPPLVILFRGRSASGMARWFDVYGVDTDATHFNSNYPMLRLTWSVAQLCGMRYDAKREAIRINGCGFSAAQDIAEALETAFSLKRGSVTYQEI